MNFGRIITVLLSIALLLASSLIGCVDSRNTGQTSRKTFVAPVYKLDSSFPKSSGISFNNVSWIERDPKTKLLYILQRSTPPISVWTVGGDMVLKWATQALGDPHSISFYLDPNGSTLAWITDMSPPLLAGQDYGHCLKAFTLSGDLVSTIGKCGESSQGTGLDPVQFDKVTDVVWDTTGNLFVSDGDLNGLNNRLLKLDHIGKVLANWNAPGDKPGSNPLQFNLPHALIVDQCDRVWVADALNHRVQVIGNDGTYHGSLTLFNDLGVYTLAFGASYSSPPETILFVGASPTSGGGTGTVFLFAAPMDCVHPDIANMTPFATFNVPLPSSTSTTLLHSITVDPDTWDVYLAVLGGNLPPQKWVAMWPTGQPPGSR